MFTKLKSVLLASMLVLAAMTLSKAGTAQFVLYDNFASRNIDPSKWVGTFADQDQREVVRTLVGEEGARHLRLSQTAYSATTDDVGSSGNIFGLQFSVPSAITEALFTVVVNRAEAVGCASNSQSTLTGPEFRGRFFNTESSPTSSLGDVEVGVGPLRTSTDAGSAMEVDFHYERCTDDFCGTRTTLGFGVLGHVQPGLANTYHIKWDQPNHQFVFQLNNGPLVPSPYTVSDNSAAFFSYRAIDIARVVPHCTTTPRPLASVDASVSNVYVNP
jgi:hypothetical protein